MNNKEPTWEPTGLADNVIVGLSAAHQFVILVTVLHLSWTFKWPPYVVRNVTLVCTTGIAGACWAVVIVSSFGVYKRTKGSLWAHCHIEIFVQWMSVGLLSNAGFIRIYRHWKLLHKHDRKMWRTEYQLALLMVPFLMPNVLYALQPNFIHFDENIQECKSELSIATPLVALWCIALLLWALYLVYSMRHLRKQFHEYFLIRRIAVLVVLAPTLFVFIDMVTGPEDGALRRRMLVVLNIFITGLMFWIPIYKPVWAFIVKDEAYLDLYTHGFFELPTPAQLRASLEDKVTIEELRQEFRRYARTRVPRELVQFYTDVLERDTVENYFERQAVTMKIIDRYVRSGSPDQVSLTEGCRKRVLDSDVTKLDIFEEARLEVLQIMEDALQQDIEAAPAYERFRAEVEGQAKERLFLIGSGILPAATTPRCSPSRPRVELTPVRVTSPTSEGDGSLCYSSDAHVYSSSSSEGHSLYSSSSCSDTPEPSNGHATYLNTSCSRVPSDPSTSTQKTVPFSRSACQTVCLDASVNL